MKKTLLLLFIPVLFIGLTNAQPVKKVLIEEATGTWCTWCPRGDVMVQNLTKKYPDNTIFIAVHGGSASEPMRNAAYDDASGFATFPSGHIDRTVLHQGTGDWEQAINLRKDQGAPAEIFVNTEYDEETRKLTMKISAEFYSALAGDHALGAIVAENGVYGPSALKFDQVNAFSDGRNGVMGGYEKLPSPVPADLMAYNHVGRYLAGGYGGALGSLPNAITAGEVHDYTYEYTVPEEFNSDNIYVVGVLIKTGSNEILQAGKGPYLPGYVNGKPFFQSTPTQLAILKGEDYSYQVVTHDPDHDELTLVASTLPKWMAMSELDHGRITLSGKTFTKGIYPVTLELSDGEWTVTQTFKVNVGNAPVTSVKENGMPGVAIYPNPATNLLTVLAESEMESLKIVDVRGKTLFESFPNFTEEKISLSEMNLSSGIYFLEANLTNGKKSIQKFVKH